MTVQEIIDLILKLSDYTIVKINIRDCSICECPYGYRFVDRKCYFDSNCDCTIQRSPVVKRDISEFENLLEMNKDTPLYQSVILQLNRVKEEYNYVIERTS